jgi:putative hydrolase of the HAD superfamily
MTAPIAAVLCDLDDTLFPQADWLAGAWRAVAESASEQGVQQAPFLKALQEIAAEGSARGGIIDRALAAVDAQIPVADLVAVFKAYRAPGLELYPGAAQALAALRERVPIAVITDGDPGIQQGKLASLGLLGAVDHVVISDQIGREFRKPHPEPFRRALAALGVEPQFAVCIGDRPDKDVAGAAALGMRAVRVRTGEYTGMPNTVAEPWFSAPGFAEAAALLLERPEFGVATGQDRAGETI